MEIEKNQGVQIDAYVNQVHDKNKVDLSEIKSDKSPRKIEISQAEQMMKHAMSDRQKDE